MSQRRALAVTPPPPADPGGARWRRRLAVAAVLLGSAGCATLFGPRRPAAEFTPYPAEQVAGVANPHAYQGKPLCQRCHVPGDGRLNSPAVALCRSCHVQRHSNHPVEVVHKTPAPGLPYLPGGLIACHTCHDPHDLGRQPKGLRLPFDQLCLACHTQHT
ncbi:MAG: cytochrome c3 family protein [Anaeromyxobacter sp.]|nr:cytochrome c3 family protein [Anaeromyxobacter sp.]